MTETINVTIRLDRDIKEQAERMFNDPFYSEKNQLELSARIADAEAGRNLAQHELIEADGE